MSAEVKNKILVTDGDGAIFDTHKIIVESMVYTVGTVSGRIITESDMSHLFGSELNFFYRQLGIAENQLAECRVVMREYQRVNFETVGAFDGAIEALYELKESGIPSVLVTSRGGHSLETLLKKTGAGEVLEAVVSDDDNVEHKPCPYPFTLALQRASQKLAKPTPRNIFVFGDTDADIRGGQNLQAIWGGYNVKTIWAEYGQKKDVGIESIPDFTVKNVREMPAIILR